jgi:hypothetical protein
LRRVARKTVSKHTRTQQASFPCSVGGTAPHALFGGLPICGHSFALVAVGGGACSSELVEGTPFMDTPSSALQIISPHAIRSYVCKNPPRPPPPLTPSAARPTPAASRGFVAVITRPRQRARVQRKGGVHRASGEDTQSSEERCTTYAVRVVINTICDHVFHTEEVVNLHHRWPEWTGEHHTAIPLPTATVSTDSA